MDELANLRQSTKPKSRILIVDDEPRVCTALIQALSGRGYECRATNSGSEAVDILEAERFDALICDLRMPGMSGLSVLEVSRSKYPWMSCLIASGVNNVEVVVGTMKQGADDFILKPFRVEALAVAVERALEKKRLEIELDAYRHRLEEIITERTDKLQAAYKSIQQTYDEIQATYDATLQALGATLASRDKETMEHAERVTSYCLEIAKALNCTPEQLTQIIRGSYLNDIGKIAMPDAILFKKDKLTSEELTVMRTHSRIGYNLVCHVPFLKEAAEIVLSHHERFDGAGYPQGLSGNDIPLGARIVAVANAFDVMVNDQPCRGVRPRRDAVAEICRCAGAQFDPKIVTAFFEWVPIHGISGSEASESTRRIT